MLIKKISICLCTYKRPHLLRKTLSSIILQDYNGDFEIVIVDNDISESAAPIFQEMQASSTVKMRYYIERVQNIACARNNAITHATGSHVAFIDDDEEAFPGWLRTLAEGLIRFNAHGVVGPVYPDFPADFPKYLNKKKLFGPQVKSEGSILEGNECATNNVLIDASLLKLRTGPFNPVLGRIGGSDIEFFCWLENAGYKLIWLPSAFVTEFIGNNRAKLLWQMRRYYRTGWVLSFITCQRYGTFLALIFQLFIKIPGSMLKGFAEAAFSIKSPSTASLLLLRCIAGQFGKLGFFVGTSIEEYKG